MTSGAALWPGTNDSRMSKDARRSPAVEATVIIAAWNAAETIGRSVACARAQRDVRVETVVIDDASSDGTLAALEPALEPAEDLVCSRLPENVGPSAARNRGLELARGAWVAILDSDDTMGEGRLRRMIDLAEAHRADVVLGNFRKIGPQGQALEPKPFLYGAGFRQPTVLSLEQYLAGDKVSNYSRGLGYLKPVIRLDFLKDHGIEYDTSLRNSEDTHLIFDCLAAGARVLFDPEADYFYTVRPGSISHRVDPVDIDKLIAAEEAFAARNRASLSAREMALLDARRRYISDMVETERVMHGLRDRRFGDAFTLLRQRPRLAPRVFGQLVESLQNRVGSAFSRRSGDGL